MPAQYLAHPSWQHQAAKYHWHDGWSGSAGYKRVTLLLGLAGDFPCVLWSLQPEVGSCFEASINHSPLSHRLVPRPSLHFPSNLAPVRLFVACQCLRLISRLSWSTHPHLQRPIGYMRTKTLKSWISPSCSAAANATSQPTAASPKATKRLGPVRPLAKMLASQSVALSPAIDALQRLPPPRAMIL
jgi:hypothetical protein